MPKRVTIMLDDELNKKLRKKQSEMIQKENKTVSFAYMINMYLRKSLN